MTRSLIKEVSDAKYGVHEVPTLMLFKDHRRHL